MVDSGPCKWKTKHLKGVVCHVSVEAAVAAAACGHEELVGPWTACLTPRESDILESARSKLVDDAWKVVDLGQSIDRVSPLKSAASCCILPGGKNWVISRRGPNRPLLALEKLALQGLQFDFARLESFGEDLLPGP